MGQRSRDTKEDQRLFGSFVPFWLRSHCFQETPDLPISTLISVDLKERHEYYCTMIPLAELANIYPGLARVGRGAGARRGQWMLRIVESSDVRDDGWLDVEGLREVGLVHGVRTERHLLRPFDLLVTARTGSVQVALVPPNWTPSRSGSGWHCRTKFSLHNQPPSCKGSSYQTSHVRVASDSQIP